MRCYAVLWQAFGSRRWKLQIATFISFFALLCFGLGLGVRPTRGWDALVGKGFYLLATAINVRYAYEGLVKFRAGQRVTAWVVLEGVTCCVLFLQLPLLLFEMGAAAPVGAVGMLLMVFKAMQVSRGNPSMSFLVMMLEEIVRDMAAFVTIVLLYRASHSIA